ncbi:hypothetical protein LTR84_011078 [Exophiala bonariae]|uniref:Altered inheritance of mitochondria protein 6 n=1 Tax=Exophiala bonariae TaxID=1690606 RepID=A0AAV9NMI5_9EURO|nr:hypothetical protein LTR84_011078 [Exophiala bonariae]
MISSILALSLSWALQVHAAAIPSSATAEGLSLSPGLQNILSNTDNNDAYTYPTDLTRGIIPKPIHSHNDYWRDVPFYSALSVGAVSVEADVSLINGTLYIGHELSALTDARTLKSLYIDPILDVLKRENPTTKFVTTPTRNGVFDTSSGQTLYLFIDLKTNGTTTWPVVVEALQPLRDAKYLTTWNGTAVTPGPVTVIGTGNTPLNQIAPLSQRDYFFDANLALLNSSQANITSGISPVASTQFSRYIGEVEGAALNDTQLSILRSQLKLAASKGIVGRYWDTPSFPISTRNSVWKTLIEEGVGLLNADDLPEAAGFGGINGYW